MDSPNTAFLLALLLILFLVVFFFGGEGQPKIVGRVVAGRETTMENLGAVDLPIILGLVLGVLFIVLVLQTRGRFK